MIGEKEWYKKSIQIFKCGNVSQEAWDCSWYVVHTDVSTENTPDQIRMSISWLNLDMNWRSHLQTFQRCRRSPFVGYRTTETVTNEFTTMKSK